MFCIVLRKQPLFFSLSFFEPFVCFFFLFLLSECKLSAVSEIFSSPKDKGIQIHIYNNVFCIEWDLPTNSFKGDPKWRIIKLKDSLNWTEIKITDSSFSAELWSSLLQNPHLDITKTWPWELPFCVWQLVSVMSWTRLICVYHIMSQHFYQSSFARS